jgi:adenine-specific DNA methylase
MISKAIEHYEKFLDLWKDADLEIAEVTPMPTEVRYARAESRPLIL